MKSCSLCGRTFPDEYSFCLTDGTPLESVGALNEEATVVRERPVHKRSGRSIVVFVLAALLSLSLGATAAVLYFFWPRQNVTNGQQIASASPSPAATETPSPKLQRSTPEPSPTEQKIANVNSSEVKPQEPPAPPNATDPGPSRISFRPGRVQETVSGTVSDSRTYILSARAGQSLSAAVISPHDCVNFASGDQTVRFPTMSGNNSLTLLNSCDRPARFTLTVSIR